MEYDVIGDVHGQGAKLRALLAKLGYRIKDGAYRHPQGRMAIFLGDLIDRGPEQRQTLDIVRRMTDAGTGRSILGNHELNAIGYATTDPRSEERGACLRRHSGKTRNSTRRFSRRSTRIPRSTRSGWAGSRPCRRVAVRRNNLQAARLLIDWGTKLEITDKEGMTGLAWARKLGLKPIQDLLLKTGANAAVDDDGSPENALTIAAGNGRLDRVKQLLAKRADANAHIDSTEERKTPLTEAAKAGHLEIVKLLLKAGAKVDKTVGVRIGTVGQTALMLAAEAGHAEVVRILLQAKANVHLPDAESLGGGGGFTPLHYAARGGIRDVVQLLLVAGAERSAKAKYGDTPLRVASSNERKQVMPGRRPSSLVDEAAQSVVQRTFAVGQLRSQPRCVLQR